MKNFLYLFALVAISMLAVGCDNPVSNDSDANNTPTKIDQQDDHAADDHAPPHGGHLIELGRNHEYHAELVEDHKTESITIYIMDSDLKPLTLKHPSISLVLSAGDNTKTFELAANQQDGSSEFTSNDSNMMEMMEVEEVKGKLRVTIDEKPFSAHLITSDMFISEKTDHLGG